MRTERISREEFVRRWGGRGYAVVDPVGAAELERACLAWARMVVGQHLGPALDALWQATLAQRDLGVRT